MSLFLRVGSVCGIKWWCVYLNCITFSIKLWISYVMGFSSQEYIAFPNSVVSSVPLNYACWLYEKREKRCLRSTYLFKYTHSIDDHYTCIDTNTAPGLLLLMLYSETLKLIISVSVKHPITVSSSVMIDCYMLIKCFFWYLIYTKVVSV